MIKQQFIFFFLILLLASACSIPGRFIGSNAILPAGLTGGDIGVAHISSTDTSDFDIRSFSIGAQIQQSEYLMINFGLVNVFSPYAGIDYRVATLKKVTFRTGLNFGFVDGTLSVPFKTNVQLGEYADFEFTLRFAGNIYNRDFRKINEENFLFTLDKTMISPWYLGGDTGFSFKILNGSHLGVRFGYYWHKDAVEGNVDRIWVISANTFLGTQVKRIRIFNF